MKIIAIMNVKGGVGKTMTACNMAYILADTYKQRVLLIDADPQANATTFFDREAVDGGLTELLQGSVSCYEDIIQKTEYDNVHLIGCDSSLFMVDLETSGVLGQSGEMFHPRNAIVSLCTALKADDSYDIVLIDCPPSFTVSAIAALAAADSVIVPVKLDAFSVDGMEFLLDQLATVHRINGNARLEGVLVTLWHNCVCNVQAEAELRGRGIRIFETRIRRSDKADESTWYRSPICCYSRCSSTARDYRDFVAEFVKEGGLKDGKV